MKRAFAIFFCLVYLISATGISVNLHYCGGKIKKISFLHNDEEGCCKGEMKKPGCCKEKNASIKIKDTQAAASVAQVPASKFIGLAVAQIFKQQLLEPVFATFVLPLSHAPPDLAQAPPYLRNRVLLI